eukprot:781037-Amphidinium_carterae.1
MAWPTNGSSVELASYDMVKHAPLCVMLSIFSAKLPPEQNSTIMKIWLSFRRRKEQAIPPNADPDNPD